MLTNTFIHIQGIGPKKEADLWRGGLLCWQDYIEKKSNFIATGMTAYIAEALEKSFENLTDPSYFARLLPSSQQWRIFPHFRDKTAYLDIETTGLGHYCEITTIALYDGETVRYYIQDENLDLFPDELEQYDVLVTYNGKSFDIPVIERYFGIIVDKVHLDLRYLLHNLGFKGGLKGCELKLGLNRNNLAGVDGYMAVLLWQYYRRTGERCALETLLAYNIMDTVNLEQLLIEVYNRNLENTPFREELKMPRTNRPQIPFEPDTDLLRELKKFLLQKSYQNSTFLID